MTKNWVTKISQAVDRHPRRFSLAAVFIYLLVIAYYMTPQILNLQTTVYGFGDNTAGAVWRYEVAPGNPFWGYQTMTNYPFGENISSPVHASGTLQYVPYWVLSAIFGPVVAYNLLNVIGLLASAMVMYGFVLYLLKNKWIALFAGYAVAFTPYYQMKVGGHPTYAFQGLIIAVIWLFFRLIEYGKLRDAVLLGIMVASTAYFDVYFALLAAVALVSLSVSLVTVRAFGYLRAKSRAGKALVFTKIKQELKNIAIAAGVAALMIMPIITFFALNQQQITTDVTAARGNVLAEAKACSNWPHEYFVPFVLNPVFQSLAGSDRYQDAVNVLRENFSCGIGEDSIGLSIVLGTIIGVVAVVLLWEVLQRRKLRLEKVIKTKQPGLVLAGLVVILFVAVSLGFPPLRFHGIIPTPSYELLSLTTTWRTLSRFYVLVNIAFISLAAIALSYLWISLKKKRWLVTAFVLVAIGVVMEYQAFAPLSGNKLSNFSYTEDAPEVYQWLRDQKDIDVVAEYPLEREGGESDAGSYYLTMQSLHRKKLFNSALSTSPQDVLRSGLKDLADPQTLPVLKQMGVDAVIVHGVKASDLKNMKGIKIVHEAPQARFNLLSHTPTVKHDTTVVIQLSSVLPSHFVATLGEGFVRNTKIIKTVVDWDYEAISGSTITLLGLTRNSTTQLSDPVEVCFSARMSVPEEQSSLTVNLDGIKRQALGRIDGQYSSYRVSARSAVQLIAENGHNMQISQIGCANEQ